MKGKLTCGHNDVKFNEKFNTDLQIISYRYQKRFGEEMEILSGVRCPECSEKVGGKKNDEHTTGNAVDILTINTPGGVESQKKFFLMIHFIGFGCCRFGDNNGALHVGYDHNLPQDVLWNYYK